MSTSSNNRGGTRPGAGRPGAPSQRIRVPEPHVPVVLSLIERLQREDADGIEHVGTVAQASPWLLRHFTEVPCGFASPAEDYEESPIDLNTVVMDPHHREATYLVRAKGHSMTGAGINDGDELVVDRALEPRNGSIVIAVYQGKATCKRLRYMANGRPYLKAENPHYEDRVIAEGDEFEIWGVVRYALHKLI